MTYERHPLSAAWPDMADEDFLALKDSIGYSGLLEPITLFDGQILDGWHRYRACLDIGINAKFSEFSGDDPAQYVRDKHTRRPLTLTQRLTCIALMSRWKPRGGNQSAVPADCSSSKDIAKAAGGGVRSAEHVKEAITKGAPELVQAMKDGKVGAEKAAAIAKLPREEQAAAIHKPAPKPAPAEVEPEIEAPPEYTELDAAKDQINELQIEVTRLNDSLAIECYDVSEEAKTEASRIIEELRGEVRSLEAQLAAVTISRDTYMQENAQMKAQMKMQRREIEKLKSKD